MSVYIAWSFNPDCSDLLGVFVTRERAQQYIDTLPREVRHYPELGFAENPYYAYYGPRQLADCDTEAEAQAALDAYDPATDFGVEEYEVIQ